MSKIFYLLFFSLYPILGADKYNCTFEKISHEPVSIQRNALVFDACSCDKDTPIFVQNAVTSLNSQSIDFKKESYCFDAKSKTAVCLQGNDSKKFQIPFYDDLIKKTVVHHKLAIDGKPLCVAVSDRFIFHLSPQGEFCFIKAPQGSSNKGSSNRWTEILIIKKFDTVSAFLDLNKQIYCFPGDSGQFYLTYDHEGCKDLFLFTIKEKETSSIVSTKVQVSNSSIKKQSKEPKKSSLNFLRLRLFGLGLLFLATIFLYYKYYSN